MNISITHPNILCGLLLLVALHCLLLHFIIAPIECRSFSWTGIKSSQQWIASNEDPWNVATPCIHATLKVVSKITSEKKKKIGATGIAPTPQKVSYTDPEHEPTGDAQWCQRISWLGWSECIEGNIWGRNGEGSPCCWHPHWNTQPAMNTRRYKCNSWCIGKVLMEGWKFPIPMGHLLLRIAIIMHVINSFVSRLKKQSTSITFTHMRTKASFSTSVSVDRPLRPLHRSKDCFSSEIT